MYDFDSFVLRKIDFIVLLDNQNKTKKALRGNVKEQIPVNGTDYHGHTPTGGKGAYRTLLDRHPWLGRRFVVHRRATSPHCTPLMRLMQSVRRNLHNH